MTSRSSHGPRHTPPLTATVAAAALSIACHSGTIPPAVGTLSPLPSTTPAIYDASRDLGPLFHDVQMARVFPDSKTFVDSRPRSAPEAIAALYLTERAKPGFDLKTFVSEHFDPPRAAATGVKSDTAQTMEEHIKGLWPSLTRPADTPDSHSSLIPLPGAYVVPGGRFREVYYWDSYFTMLGLIQDGRLDLVKNMLDGFAYLVKTVGHVPNGNRSYYLSRSQPPYLAAMVGLYATATDTTRALEYLPTLEAEHAFWMAGADTVKAGSAARRVVRLRDGSLLNRYWDDRPEPRPESYREDFELAQRVAPEKREQLYRDIRAAAESGWDFSSRWMRDPKDLRTLETTELVPVDLNSLLYHAERTIAALRLKRGAPGDAEVAARYGAEAEARRKALLAAAYDPTSGYFYDVRWRSGERVTDRPTMAAAAPLYFGLATPEQGRAVADRLGRDFLSPGGFATTQIRSGQQWDAPNGWAPLQWLGVQATHAYGRDDIANDARSRWLALNRRTYRVTGKMTEKYDVLDMSKRAGGGEYPAQDGFGWTNGVARAMAAQEAAHAPTPAPARP